MTRRSVVVCSSIALVAAAALAAAEDASRVLAYSAVEWPGDSSGPSERTKKAACDLIVARCKHAGFDGVTAAVGANGIGVEVRVPSALAASEAAIRRLVERRGRFEFRVRAESGFEQEHRERKFEGAPTPKGFAWCDDEQGGLAMLVETPEQPVAAAVQEIAKKGAAPDAPELVAAMTELAKTQAANVFTNWDVATSDVERKISTHGAYTRLRVAVRFEFKDARKAAFEKFTGDHVGRALAVVIDGKVHVAPVVKSALPGAGQWIGPGEGYTDESAQETAALLASAPMPCRLVPEGK